MRAPALQIGGQPRKGGPLGQWVAQNRRDRREMVAIGRNATASVSHFDRCFRLSWTDLRKRRGGGEKVESFMSGDDFHFDIDAKAAAQLTQEDLAALGGPNMVYVREVAAKDVMPEIQAMHGEEDMIDLPEEAVVYALHAVDGERLAIVGDRDLAFVAARQNEMDPVSVH